ncbi:MAG: enoyl-CoA hydratase/isomerase family protein [Rhodospirillum sp.]|nr:enoyl-CoA hydratase/isomerase family protein [Rhodospirillum sp.]
MTALRETIDDRGVARLTMNRPEVRNAFDDALIGALTAAFERLGADPEVRVIVLASVGKAFSAGADLNWMKRMAAYSREDNVTDALGLARMCAAIDLCPKPTLALVQGAAFGGGVGLVAAVDIAIAADPAKFCLSEVRLGLIPAVISPYVNRAIGARACRRYFLTADVMDAATALRLGLVSDVVAPDTLEEAGEAVIASLLAAGPIAQAEAKAQVRLVESGPVERAMIQETAERIADRRASDEGRDGIGAFLEKRMPSWTATQDKQD